MALLGFLPNSFTLLIERIRRFDERKGIETLVRAVALLKKQELQNLTLIIVGGSSANMPDGEGVIKSESSAQEEIEERLSQ